MEKYVVRLVHEGSVVARDFEVPERASAFTAVGRAGGHDDSLRLVVEDFVSRGVTIEVHVDAETFKLTFPPGDRFTEPFPAGQSRPHG